MDFSDTIKASRNLKEHLKYSEKNSMTSFIYSSEADMLRAQALFIDIGNHMLEFCDYVDQFLRVEYYGILCAVLERGELDIGQMQVEKDSLSNKSLFANKKKLLGAH